MSKAHDRRMRPPATSTSSNFPRKPLVLARVSLVNPPSNVGFSSPLADFPTASTPALIMATAGLITAFSGLTTAIGGQIVPLIGRWLDAYREARRADEAQNKIAGNLQLAIDRVTQLESAVRENGERISKNAASMHGNHGCGVKTDTDPELLRRLLELESIVREYDKKVDNHTQLVQHLTEKVEATRRQSLY